MRLAVVSNPFRATEVPAIFFCGLPIRLPLILLVIREKSNSPPISASGVEQIDLFLGQRVSECTQSLYSNRIEYPFSDEDCTVAADLILIEHVIWRESLALDVCELPTGIDLAGNPSDDLSSVLAGVDDVPWMFRAPDKRVLPVKPASIQYVAVTI